MSPSLRQALDVVSSTCSGCNLCQDECAFLRKYGNPKEIADTYDPSREEHQAMPFECSLCTLCRAVCPTQVNPAVLFLEMRRETARRGCSDYPEHEALKGYERRGSSRIFSYYGLPEGSDTVFFPGCTLSGTRSEKVIEIYQRVKSSIPSLGIVLDCCTSPSHDLGRQEYFMAMFREMADFLVGHGVSTVLAACPNCYRIFQEYGGRLLVKSIYEELAKYAWAETRGVAAMVTVHDPCAVRFVEPLRAVVRELIRGQGLVVEEMAHAGETTLCCGEGGGVSLIAPGLAKESGRLRRKEAGGRTIITCCAGCAGALSRIGPTVHLVDVLFEPGRALGGKARVAKPPLTYWKRLRLKKWFKQNVAVAMARERKFAPRELKSKM